MVQSSVYSKKTKQTTQDTRYYLSSQEPADRTPEQWQALIRGHWAGVEIRNHWRRDSLWGEDRSRTRKARALANLALVRNALLALTPIHFPELPLKQVFEQLHSNPAAGLRVIAQLCTQNKRPCGW